MFLRLKVKTGLCLTIHICLVVAFGLHNRIGATMADNFNIAAGFIRSTTKHADQLFYSDAGRDATYREMGDTVGRLAALLSRHGRPRRVGILATRSYEAYAGMLASGLAGAAYVPISLKSPESRILALLEFLELDALVVDANGARLLTPAVLNAAPELIVLSDEADQVDAPAKPKIIRLGDIADAPLAVPAPVAAEDLAYIVFTSGTTGMPKGVMISAGSLRNYLEETRPWTNLTPQDRVAETHDITFDLSVHNLFLTAEAGASLHVLSALEMMAPGRFVRAREITAWMSVPTLAAMMRRTGALKPGVFPSLRLSIFCGEPLPVAAAQAWAAAAPNSVVENAYGPAEATVICLRQTLTDPPRVTADRGIVAIGKPYDTMQVAILDADRRPVADGKPGEIALAGPQLAVNYFKATDDQARRFREIDGRRWYMTGDLGMRDADGVFHHLGRTDNQVKVKGNRIELEEIEAHLRRAAASEAVAVVAWPVLDGSAQGLVGFCSSPLSADVITTAMLETLPRYMVPSAIHILDSLPVNTSGKIDRAALLARLEAAAQARAVQAAPPEEILANRTKRHA
jgi:D-alanine--poly(phosphoribitol) ligase subunit 1